MDGGVPRLVLGYCRDGNSSDVMIPDTAEGDIFWRRKQRAGYRATCRAGMPWMLLSRHCRLVLQLCHARVTCRQRQRTVLIHGILYGCSAHVALKIRRVHAEEAAALAACKRGVQYATVRQPCVCRSSALLHAPASYVVTRECGLVYQALPLIFCRSRRPTEASGGVAGQHGRRRCTSIPCAIRQSCLQACPETMQSSREPRFCQVKGRAAGSSHCGASSRMMQTLGRTTAGCPQCFQGVHVQVLALTQCVS